MTRRIPPLPEPRVVVEFTGRPVDEPQYVRVRTEYRDADGRLVAVGISNKKVKPPCSTDARS